MTDRKHPFDVSIVIPMLDEEPHIVPLVSRLAAAMEKAGHTWELIAVLDGCTDNSLGLLLKERAAWPAIRIVDLAHGVGQHAAIATGLRYTAGRFIVTLDADLQNPPEAVAEVVARLASDAQAVGTVRRQRRDPHHRLAASRLFAVALVLAGTRHRMADPGCMLRGWTATVVQRFLASGEPPVYLPVQLNRYADTYAEFATDHKPRLDGTSRYNAWKLGRLFARALLAQRAPDSLRAPIPRVAAVYGEAPPGGGEA